ncbi:MAG: nucleoside monophosphate kinase [Acidobacteria bacterium]|nr:nucleoside monophosphate kinase [Acidobacteriota bacterium]
MLRPTLLALSLFSVSLFAEQPLVTGPVVILLGPPGSGKSTQAVEAAKYLKVPVVSVADLIKDNRAVLEQARVPGITGMEPETDPLLNRFFAARIKRGDLASGMILDGYPCTKDQADFVSKLAASGAISKGLVLHIKVSDEVVLQRMGGKHKKLPASVEQRLKDYHRETAALEIYYPSASIIPIDGAKKPGAVTKQIKAALKAQFGK